MIFILLFFRYHFGDDIQSNHEQRYFFFNVNARELAVNFIVNYNLSKESERKSHSLVM